MITGQVWLRVPESIRVVLTGRRHAGVGAKDIALALVAEIGPEGGELSGDRVRWTGLATLSLEDRLVVSNLAVETGREGGDLSGGCRDGGVPGATDADARNGRAAPTPARAMRVKCHSTCPTVVPNVAFPHSPANVRAIGQAIGIPVHMVFIGTCTGGRVADFHEALAVLERAGGRVAPGVQLVITPASREVARRLTDRRVAGEVRGDGRDRSRPPGAVRAAARAASIPGDGCNVLSTANRNFKARMGNAHRVDLSRVAGGVRRVRRDRAHHGSRDRER